MIIELVIYYRRLCSFFSGIPPEFLMVKIWALDFAQLQEIGHYLSQTFWIIEKLNLIKRKVSFWSVFADLIIPWNLILAPFSSNFTAFSSYWNCSIFIQESDATLQEQLSCYSTRNVIYLLLIDWIVLLSLLINLLQNYEFKGRHFVIVVKLGSEFGLLSVYFEGLVDGVFYEHSYG